MTNAFSPFSRTTRIAGAVLFILGLAATLVWTFNPIRSSAALIPGYAWSDTIGWIQLSDSVAGYGLNIDAAGNMTGYAWSENIGWISAQASDVAGCPAGTCTPRLTGTTMTGWLKAIAANGNGWDGWISLSCSNTGTCGTSNYGVTKNGNVYGGYAWGSDVVGWIDFSYAYSTALACTITPTQTSILRGSAVGLQWEPSNASTGSISPTVGDAGITADIFSVTPNVTTTYTGTVTRTTYATTTGAGVNTTFNSSGTFIVPANVYSIDALIIAGGGGGGGGASGGGGGAGGVREVTGIPVTPGQTLTITVGAGGAGTTGTGNSGGNSAILNGATTLASAVGGGGGGPESSSGLAGGSGGGAGGVAGSGGAGTAGQGNTGGTNASAVRHAGGGGGAGAAGGAGSGTGVGGAGITTSAIYGSLVVGGGGGGAAERIYGSNAGGAGGTGGGGQACGNGLQDANGVAATPNTGGGGGGGGRCGAVAAPNTTGGNGGSGKIIVRHTSVTVTPTPETSTCSAIVNVTCAPIYQCSGQTIQYTDASCNTSNVTTCVSPSYCTPGQASCTVPPPAFTGSGSLTGHLQAKPQVVRMASSTVLYWNVTNAQSCTVTGNGDSWSTASSSLATCTKRNGGCLSSPINNSATYTLSCTALAGSGSPNVSETVTITPSPTYQEI